MDRVETRELEYFVAVAEELHFGRAAQRLGIAQPPLSRAIGRLERRMGVRLFDRANRRVQLTRAGEVLLAEGRDALRAVDSAVRNARRAGQQDRLVLATRPGVGHGLLSQILCAYQQRADAVEVDVVFTNDQVATLRDGGADIGLLCAGGAAGLATAEVAEEKPIALLPRGHRLASSPGVLLAELAEDKAFGVVRPSHTLEELIDLVSIGQLIVVMGAGVLGRLPDAVVGVPVLDMPVIQLVLAWPEGAEPTGRAAFVQAAQSLG